MPNVYKILGQSSPAATTPTDLYTVPATTSAICSSISICNRGTTQTTFRVSISQAGAATTNKDYLYYIFLEYYLTLRVFALIYHSLRLL